MDDEFKAGFDESFIDDLRFNFINEEEADKRSIKYFAPKTLVRIEKTEKLFYHWLESRNAKHRLSLTKRMPVRNLENYTDEELDRLISLFILEVRRVDGIPYRSETLKGMVLLLQMSLSQKFKNVKFLNDGEKFMKIRNAFDGEMRRLQELGFGVSTKVQADTPPEVNLLIYLRSKVLYLRSNTFGR